MTPTDLLARLESLGVGVTAEGSRLRVSAARGQIGEELKAAIAAQKAELLELLARRSKPEGRSLSISRIARTEALPLSIFQERLWAIQRLEPADTAYNIGALWRSREPADTDRMAGALRAVVARHEILRLVFRDNAGIPSAFTLPPEAVPIEVVDLRGQSAAEQAAQVEAANDRAAHRPFDLEREPPVRFTIFQLGGEVGVLVSVHHIAVDAWSLALLGREVLEAYRSAGALGPPPDLQYADFAAWERSRYDSPTAAGALGWWKQRLEGAPPLSTLPTDLDREAAAGAIRSSRLTPEASAAVRAMVREQGATVYMALLAAMAAVLHWYTGQDDLVLGSPMGVRESPELEKIIGPFVNLLVLRMDLSGDPTFAELVARARAVVLDAHAHREVPFEKIVQHVKPARSVGRPPLFQVAVVQHNAPDAESVAMASGGAIHDLTWYVREEQGQLVGAIEYRSDLYSAEAIERLASRLELLLTLAAADPQRRLSQLSLVLPDERERVLEAFNATGRDTDPAPFVVQFERQVVATPEACAVAFARTSVSYRELNARANQVARHLRTIGIGPGVIAGLCMQRSLDLVVALLGIQKAGGAYLPLDPDFPPDRLSYMLADSGARALVTAEELPGRLVVPEGVAIVDLASVQPLVGTQPCENLEGGAGPADLAYVMYTSGSTGRPKGVRVGHAALSNFLGSMRVEPGLEPTDVLAAVTTLSFDIAGLELYLPLTVGARVQLVPKATASDGRALSEALESCGATVLQATPATWRLLVEAGWRGHPGFKALCGGEPLGRELADALLDRTSELWNMYGPTETTIWSTADRVLPGTGPVLIGKPIANTRVYVLTGGGHPLPPRVPGEIWIGGAGVAEGYHGRPELTAARFVPDPFVPTLGARMYRTGDLGRWNEDGKLEHLGRLDHQVKVRGFRIELGEIETVLAAHPGVRQAVVLARENAPGDVRLVAYVVYEPGEDLTVSDIRRHLRRELPDYMIPSIVVTLDSVPLTPNGKLDRAALPDPFAAASRAGPGYVPPASGAEQVLAEIWKEVLQVEKVGAEDNFFELGGHSLLSLRVAAAVERRLGWRMDPRVLFFQNLRQIAGGAAARAGGA